MKKILIAFSFGLCISCQASKKGQSRVEGDSFILTNDTIYSKLNYCLKSDSSNREFYNILGIKLSKDYSILDSINIYLNSDDKLDKLLVLSPTIQEEHESSSPCYNMPFNNRLFVVILSSSEKYSVEIVNEKLILNNSEYYSLPYKGISIDKDGFILKFFVGSSIRCNYSFYFKKANNEYYLYKRKYGCYMIDLSNNKKNEDVYQFSDSTKLQNINIRKFITIPDLNIK